MKLTEIDTDVLKAVLELNSEVTVANAVAVWHFLRKRGISYSEKEILLALQRLENTGQIGRMPHYYYICGL